MLIEASNWQLNKFSKNKNISICIVVDSIYMLTGVARKRRIESINYSTQAVSAGLNQMDYSICFIGRTKTGKRRLVKIVNGNHQNVEYAKQFYWQYLERYKSKFTEKEFADAESLFVEQNLQTESFCFIGRGIDELDNGTNKRIVFATHEFLTLGHMNYSIEKIKTDKNDIDYFLLNIENASHVKGQQEILYYLLSFIISKHIDRYIRIIEVPKELGTQQYRNLVDDLIGIKKEQFQFCI